MDDVLLRGGAWYNHPWNCRSTWRDLDEPDNAYVSIGFRIVGLLRASHTIRLEKQFLLRGGALHNRPWHCRSACRIESQPDHGSPGIGFRIVGFPQAGAHTIQLEKMQ